MKKNGFSLMEMMIVLTIVAIVAAASAPMINRKTIRAASEKSPWVFVNARRITYNPSGEEQTASIGAEQPPAEQPVPRLYINTDSDTHPHIIFANQNSIMRMIAGGTKDNLWISTRGISDDANGSVVLGSGSSSNCSHTVAIGTATASSNDSIAIGNSSTTSGFGAVAIGKDASAGGTHSIAIGSSVDYHLPMERVVADGWRSIALGHDTKSSSNCSIAIGNGANASSNQAIALGDTANASRNNAIAIGHGSIAQAQNSVAIGNGANVTGLNSVALGAGVQVQASNCIVLGTNKDKVVVYGTMEVQNLHVTSGLVVEGSAVLNKNNGCTLLRESNGNMSYVIGDDFSGKDDNLRKADDTMVNNHCKWLSDRRLKNVGKAFKGGLNEIRKLQVFNYTFKNDKSKTPYVGVMAQDLQKVFPNAVTKGEDGFLRIRMEDMFYAVINAVKEIDLRLCSLEQKQNKVNELEKQVNELNKQNKELLKRIEALEKAKK